MVLQRISFQSEDETLLIDISKNDEYGWDITVHQFPMGDLMGSYNDLGKLIDDIRPFVMFMPQSDRIRFAEEFKKIE